jgi:DNA mismatch endonuclease, patch repair protein
MDTVSKEVRSRNMAAIRGKNTKPEMAVRRFLHSRGYRYRLHKKNLPGIPDIYLKKYKTVIFVHGCFWHQHPNCKYATVPKSNEYFWVPKLKKNVDRDRANIKALKALGCRVVVFWECEVFDKKTANIKPANLLKKLEGIKNAIL